MESGYVRLISYPVFDGELTLLGDCYGTPKMMMMMMSEASWLYLYHGVVFEIMDISAKRKGYRHQTPLSTFRLVKPAGLNRMFKPMVEYCVSHAYEAK